MIAITETPLTKALKRTLYHWGPDIFGIDHLDRASLLWRPCETGFLLTVDGQPASYFRALRATCQVDGRTVLIGGLGGLVTVPAHQRQGYGARVTTAAVTALRDVWRVEAALAFCLDHMLLFYRRLGALVVACPVLVQTRRGMEPSPFEAIWWPFRTELVSATTIDLGGPLW